MTDAGGRRFGAVFDEIADQYDRHRPTYPDALVDRACEVARLEPGDPVLELGCGTGQLTRSLLARDLHVTAVEPGRNLVARARAQLEGAGGVRFVNSRLEDASLPLGRFRAVFSASAIHWVDPEVSWRRSAAALSEGGTLALISYVGCNDTRSAADQQALRQALNRVAPELGAVWPAYHDLDEMLAGAAARRGNVSAVWAWLAGHDVAREYAAGLFDEAEAALVPVFLEHDAAELNALLATMSFWARLSATQREALIAENTDLFQRLGRPIRSSTVACLVTAQRAADA